MSELKEREPKELEPLVIPDELAWVEDIANKITVHRAETTHGEWAISADHKIRYFPYDREPNSIESCLQAASLGEAQLMVHLFEHFADLVGDLPAIMRDANFHEVESGWKQPASAGSFDFLIDSTSIVMEYRPNQNVYRILSATFYVITDEGEVECDWPKIIHTKRFVTAKVALEMVKYRLRRGQKRYRSPAL